MEFADIQSHSTARSINDPAFRVMDCERRGGIRRIDVRIRIVAWAAAAAWMAVSAASPARAVDYPYYRLNYAAYDTTYEAVDAQARRLAYFYWDGKAHCRYRTGWNGPGAYEVGTRDRPGYGWEGGYDWQGPGTPADHGNGEDFAAIQADYHREFGNAAVCEPPRVRYRLHHSVVLRRKD